MSRSFGDLIGATVGVISEPELSVRHLHPNDKFLIIGSDGLWEFMSNQEVVDIVGR
jgi:serine/threonine protein phosphatase PrpC